MKANIFTRPEVAAALRDHVLVELSIDGGDAPSEENQRLQETKFETVQMPYFVLMDPDQNVVAVFPEATRDADKFLEFLQARTL
jgi:thiol:disulfide interchange protein DsbD